MKASIKSDRLIGSISVEFVDFLPHFLGKLSKQSFSALFCFVFQSQRPTSTITSSVEPLDVACAHMSSGGLAAFTEKCSRKLSKALLGHNDNFDKIVR